MKRKFHNNVLDWRTFSMVGAVLLALGTSNIPVASAADTEGTAVVSETAASEAEEVISSGATAAA